jgi:GAF domain-containing protein
MWHKEILARLESLGVRTNRLCERLEEARVQALHDIGILDTPRQEAFDEVVALAAEICQCPMAGISFLDKDRQWYKSNFGFDISETPREVAICNRTIADPRQEITELFLDQMPEMATNPFVCEPPYLKFYAASPLTTKEGFALGALCVLDSEPRKLTEKQRECLVRLKKIVMGLLAKSRYNV